MRKCFHNASEGRKMAWTTNQTKQRLKQSRTWTRTEKSRNPKSFILRRRSGSATTCSAALRLAAGRWTQFVQKVHTALICKGTPVCLSCVWQTAIQNINKKMNTASEGTHCMHSAAIEAVQGGNILLLYEHCKSPETKVCMKVILRRWNLSKGNLAPVWHVWQCSSPKDWRLEKVVGWEPGDENVGRRAWVL